MSFITRKVVNKKFVYTSARQEDLERIKKLKIPPMWINVKINPSSKSKLQATGYDSKGRKQYIYHKNFIEKSKTNKFNKMNSFDYSKYSRVIRHHISKKDLTRECVIANALKIMEDLNIRVGNENYKKQNGTFGITTLLKKHLRGNKLEFIGKKAIAHSKTITNPLSLDFISRVLKINGPQLFCDSTGYNITSSDLNSFLREKVQSNITCKDIRTYCANKIFKTFMNKLKRGITEKDRKNNIIKGVDYTANELGNTRKVCRDSYLCPNVVAKYS